MEFLANLSLEPWQIGLVIVAGIAAGGINAVVGSGTLITFPALVAFGVPPVVSTMTRPICHGSRLRFARNSMLRGRNVRGSADRPG